VIPSAARLALIVGEERARLPAVLALANRMLLTNIPCKRVSTERAIQRRNKLLREIFSDFGQAFSNLHFELDEESSTVNAQAFVRGEKRVVRMYGGLAYHAVIGVDGLVFTLLHEAGHHLASGGRLASSSELGCECAADRWALTKGSAKLRKETGRTFAIGRVVSSLEKLTVPASCDSGTEKDGPRICWAKYWSKRRRVLAGPEAAPAIPRCYLSEFFTSEANYV
jgi:hypothetical protein